MILIHVIFVARSQELANPTHSDYHLALPVEVITKDYGLQLTIPHDVQLSLDFIVPKVECNPTTFPPHVILLIGSHGPGFLF